MNSQTRIRIPLAWWEALLILAAFIVPALYGGRALSLLTGIAASIAFAAWRIVRILSQLLDMRQAEFFAEEDS